mmetsp:Transcript_41866/g.68920  ORF Transcript_41866/g.68920 Transcript_41866/m.68920 type:complete len:103 (-) Transcript_41866:783-1091(-)
MFEHFKMNERVQTTNKIIPVINYFIFTILSRLHDAIILTIHRYQLLFAIAQPLPIRFSALFHPQHLDRYRMKSGQIRQSHAHDPFSPTDPWYLQLRLSVPFD